LRKLDDSLPTWSGPHHSWNSFKCWKIYYDEVLPKLEAEERAGKVILPPREHRFNAFQLGVDDIKVVLLGQDPYSTKGDAHGYSFSVQPHRRIPPSLSRIFSEYQDDLQYSKPSSGDLRRWASRGVFLLNTALTVREGIANSHTDIWSKFTYVLLSELSRRRKGIVYVLLGAKAQQYKALIDEDHNCVICAGHPSPLNRAVPFLGCKMFSRSCKYLGLTPEELWKL
jgi:uracil-DNA glycosylase